MSSSGVVTLTYAPRPGPDGSVASQADLEKLVTVATELRRLDGVTPLYDDIATHNGQVRFAVRFDSAPTIGLHNLARGLVTRAFSEAATPGELREVDVTDSQ